MDFVLVTQEDDLELICKNMSDKPRIMVDTEFVRIRTLYPKLGLIQLYDGETLALIDPIAISDLSPLWELMANESILKVLHACSEDLEVFQNEAGFIPTPFVDTQIMAAFLGHGLSTGFAALVNQYLDVELDKGESRTNWCMRPLTQNQLNYAAADVFYLLPLFEHLNKQIQELNWQDALKQECQQLAKKRKRKVEPELIYRDIKNAWQLKPKQLAALQKLSIWRYNEAKKRNLALNFVVKDLHLWKMAKFNIRSLDKMKSEGFDNNEIEYHGHRMLRIMSDVDKLSEAELPPKITRLVDMPSYKAAVKLLKEQINYTSEKLNLVPEFIGSKKQIHQILKWIWLENKAEDKTPELLSGWRSQFLSEKIVSVLAEIEAM